MDEVTLLKGLRASEEHAERGEARAHARSALLDRIHDAQRGKRGERWLPHARRIRILPVGVAVSVLVAALVGSAVLLDPRGVEAEAAEVLNRTADVAAAQPAPSSEGLGPGEYWYAKSESAYLSTVGDPSTATGAMGVTALVPSTREIWLAPDGSGRIVQRNGEATFFGERDRRRWEEAGRPDMSEGAEMDDTFGPGGLYWEDVDSYPTDPGDLFEVIEARAEGTDVPVGTEMLVILGDLLRETAAPPALRSALYRVAARIPGVELVGRVTDPAGRPGIAVALRSDHNYPHRMELVFDPDTSEFLAEREVLLERIDWLDAEPFTVISYSVHLRSGVVGSLSERLG